MFAASILLVANEAAALVQEQQAVVQAAQQRAFYEEVTLPTLESGKWTFARREGRLVGTIEVETRSVGLFNTFAAVYGPSFLESPTPFRLPVVFSSDGHEDIPSDVRPLLDWCRRRLKTASLPELDTRLWVALNRGSPEQGEEAVRLMTEVYRRHKFALGFNNLLKHCVRSGPGDPLPVLRASENLLRKIPRSEARILASRMSREWPGWRQELNSDWPINPDEPWDAE